jgi:branched-chain amino acid transport system substrate-binding protein
MLKDQARLKQLGAVGFMPPLETSCADHEGSGLVRFMRWDGARWNIITDYWMAPTPEDRKLVQQKLPRLRDEVRQRKGHHAAPLSGVVTGRASWISL